MVITAEVMLTIWAALAILAMYVTHRTRFTPLLFVASAALPWIVFYAVTVCGCWSSLDFAVAYSRWTNVWAALNLAAMLVVIKRGRVHGLDD